jgi:hypothetical protein
MLIPFFSSAAMKASSVSSADAGAAGSSAAADSRTAQMVDDFPGPTFVRSRSSYHCRLCVKGQQLTNPETADPADTECQGRAA